MGQVNVEYTQDEIRMYDLFRIMAKRKVLIMSFLVMSVLLGIFTLFISTKIYIADIVLKIPSFESAASNLTAKELIESIGTLDREKIKRMLPKTNEAVTQIKFENLKESKDKILVTLESKDVKLFSSASVEIIDYINTLDLMKANSKDEQERLLKRQNELSSVIDASSGLFLTYRKLLDSGKLVPVGFNPVELDKRISDLKVEKFVLEQITRRLSNGVEIVRQLFVHQKPIKPKKVKIVIIFGMIGLVAGIFAAFVWEYLASIRNSKVI